MLELSTPATYTLDGAACPDLEGFYAELLRVLEPAVFGHNRDAVVDVLRDVAAAAPRTHVRIIHSAALLRDNPADRRSILLLLGEVALDSEGRLQLSYC